MHTAIVAFACRLTAALLPGILMANTAFAGNSTTLSVSAVILSINKCKFTNAGPTALSFGSINPWSTSDATASASTTFKCTGSNANATYSITSNDGQNASGSGNPRMIHATNISEFLAYSLNFPQSGTVPKNTTQTLSIVGTITPSAFQNALVGNYADSVTLTIAP